MQNDVGQAKTNARRICVNGEVWLVYELPSQYDRRGPSLVFESENVVRRVRNFPPDWLHVADTDLARVMEVS
ncbi:MAG TPA: hypothetical protein VJN70_10140 [Gemmatimonadaceae bacterium]|nr:hypothetical protein [Gemmatimonadaceae bacterium]